MSAVSGTTQLSRFVFVSRLPAKCGLVLNCRPERLGGIMGVVTGGSVSKGQNQGLHRVNPLRVLLFGRPTPTEHQEHARLPKILALPVFASDAISSSVYATQEILLALAVAGLYALQFTVHLSLAISILLFIVAISYSQ